jgi:hypothetical protein
MSIRSVLLSRAVRVLLIVLVCPAARGETGDALSPLRASLDQILATASSQWRSPSQETFRWEMFPDIIVIDTIDFVVQDRTFTRIAYFLEKRGFRGRLLRNTQLAGRHGWNAHDYGPDGLASFFNAAEDVQFPLNAEEMALRTLAMEQGILARDGGRFQPGRGGILGLSRSSSPIERRYLLTHESFHGIFFSSQEYRDFCFRLWDSLTPGEREFYRSFLDSLGYDSADEFLAVNEFQAYLMQQPLEYASSYFARFTKVFSRNGAREAIDPARLLAHARSLDAFLQDRFAISAGGTLLAGSRTVTAK